MHNNQEVKQRMYFASGCVHFDYDDGIRLTLPGVAVAFMHNGDMASAMGAAVDTLCAEACQHTPFETEIVRAEIDTLELYPERSRD